mmetsp:Transcript_57657/g.122648  ORF Transcript_57657/g.122648 Transcript_57657/m.122648 type:complete len:121 (-) Transcript_57657:244-606(-)
MSIRLFIKVRRAPSTTPFDASVHSRSILVSPNSKCAPYPGGTCAGRVVTLEDAEEKSPSASETVSKEADDEGDEGERVEEARLQELLLIPLQGRQADANPASAWGVLPASISEPAPHTGC